MSCWSAKRRITEYVDRRLRETERRQWESHLTECVSCSIGLEEVSSVRAAVANLPQPVAPAELKTALHVRASQEREAIIASHGSRWAHVWDQWKFRIRQFVRPLTIPATGGLVSSLLLFGALMFTIATDYPMVSYEVPVLYADHTDANLVPIELRSSVMLTFSLDGSGRITDYAVRDGDSSFVGDASRLQSNVISLPAFPSVLALAQPINGDVSILLRPIVFRQ